MARPTIEKAVSEINKDPKMSGKRLAFWEAVRDGTLPSYFLHEFTSKRHDYSDKLPAIDVRYLPETIHVQVAYKCQTHFGIGLTLDLRAAINYGVIVDHDIIEAIEAFLLTDLDFTVGDKDNQARLDRINAILDLVIDHLSLM